jgi:hypothetical protein
MHYAPLSCDDALWQTLRDFTMRFLQRSPNAESMTGHLSFGFMVDSGGKGIGSKKNIYAIECNPRADTAVVLFGQQGLVMRRMVEAYLSAIDDSVNGSAYPKVVHVHKQDDKEPLVMPSKSTRPRYWIGYDLVALLLHPLLCLGTGSKLMSFKRFLTSSLIFREHLFTWKEGTFEGWDPLPALVLYHVYLPLTILLVWWQGRH